MIKIILNILFIVIIGFCGCKEEEESKQSAKPKCNVNKIDLLLKEIMNKRFFCENIEPVGEDKIPYRNVLRLNNLPANDSVYYWKISANLNPDSIKISLLKDTVNRFIRTNAFGISLKKTNRDTTDISVNINFGQNKMALKWSTYHYKFDLELCKWIIKDSVYNEY